MGRVAWLPPAPLSSGGLTAAVRVPLPIPSHPRGPHPHLGPGPRCRAPLGSGAEPLSPNAGGVCPRRGSEGRRTAAAGTAFPPSLPPVCPVQHPRLLHQSLPGAHRPLFLTCALPADCAHLRRFDLPQTPLKHRGQPDSVWAPTTRLARRCWWGNKGEVNRGDFREVKININYSG